MDYRDLFLQHFNKDIHDIDPTNLDQFMIYIEKIKIKLIHENIQRNRVQAIKWVDSKNVSTCNKCYKEFTLFRRKHHCRSCGYVFCDKCSDYKKPCPILGYYKDVRHCQDCYYALNEDDFKEVEKIRSEMSQRKFTIDDFKFQRYDEV